MCLHVLRGGTHHSLCWQVITIRHPTPVTCQRTAHTYHPDTVLALLRPNQPPTTSHHSRHSHHSHNSHNNYQLSLNILQNANCTAVYSCQLDTGPQAAGEMSLRNRLERLFGEKVVMELNCKFCSSKICRRGMRALLLADTKTELFSTDLPPTHTTALVGGDYRTSSCDCKISDVACLTW